MSVPAISHEEQGKQVGMSTIEQLSTDIMNSIQIELSPETQAQQAKALEGCEDATLSESFPPLKWTSPSKMLNMKNVLKKRYP